MTIRRPGDQVVSSDQLPLEQRYQLVLQRLDHAQTQATVNLSAAGEWRSYATQLETLLIEVGAHTSGLPKDLAERVQAVISTIKAGVAAMAGPTPLPVAGPPSDKLQAKGRRAAAAANAGVKRTEQSA